MKKVVIIGPAYPYRGGQALVEAYLYHTLTKFGYDCETVSFTVLYPKVFFPGTTQYDESKSVFFEHNDKIKRIINSINPITWWRAAKAVKEMKPDITIFVWWMPFFGPAYSIMIKLIRRWTNSKVVFLVENFISHENRWFDILASKMTLNRADAFICQSSYVKKCLVEYLKPKPIYQTTLSVFDCFDLKRYNYETSKAFLNIKTKKVVLFFGLIRAYKGLDKLILAFKYIQAKFSDTTLLIVGECYEDIEKYKKLIQQEGITNQTILVNQFIPNESVEPYIKAADVVCLPYNSATQSGILMMAYGLRRPVIVTDVGGLAELVVQNKTGLVIPNNDPKTVAEANIKMLENKNQEDFEYNIANIAEGLGYANLEQVMKDILG